MKAKNQDERPVKFVMQILAMWHTEHGETMVEMELEGQDTILVFDSVEILRWFTAADISLLKQKVKQHIDAL